MNIILNPKYILKPDEGRVLLLAKDTLRFDDDIDNSLSYIVHPIHAIILSFFTGEEYFDSVKKAADFLKIRSSLIEKFTTKLINNETQVGVEFNGLILTFPENTLIESTLKRSDSYDPNIFAYETLDLRNKRHKTPTHITLMVNNKCRTNCIYCYADRRNKIDCQIDFMRIKEIIYEAKTINVSSISVIGGEFFLYSNWKNLLLELKKYGYSPYLSTKIPLKESDIKFLAEIEVSDIQISLDTLIPEHLQSILRVNSSYVTDITNSIYLLEKYNIKTNIHTVLTNVNDSIADMNSIFNFIVNLKNINYWKPDLVGPSLYISESSFEQIKPKKPDITILVEYFKQMQNISAFPIKYQGIVRKNLDNIDLLEKHNQFHQRGACTGNYSHLFILPDGQVTICEELYWHPQFILGNINKQSLLQIWNSDTAKNKYAFPQELISKESACALCSEYQKCRSVKQVCWRDIIKAYGQDKWFYPDVNCSRAPKATYNIDI
ncbi:MAG: radical SAM protein [Bacteroidota bacterium]|nr:radical SAM protein [Bacteroidota bacterium]